MFNALRSNEGTIRMKEDAEVHNPFEMNVVDSVEPTFRYRNELWSWHS